MPKKDIQWYYNYFYLDSNPDVVIEMIKKDSKEGIFDKSETINPETGFYSGIFQKFPERAREWIEKIQDLPLLHKEVIYAALWISRIKESKSILGFFLQKTKDKDEQEFLDASLNNNPSDIFTAPIDFPPSNLDVLWGLFMSTGDERCIKRIIEVACFSPKTPEETMAIPAAQWSLKSNALQHGRVLEICKEEFKKYSQNNILAGIIDSVKKQKKNLH